MNNTTHVIGVDPGLVHTGVVRFLFEPEVKLVEIEHEVLAGCKAADVEAFRTRLGQRYLWGPIFIEGYRQRSHIFREDEKMRRAITELKAGLPSRAVVLDNMGVKKVVKRPFMEALGVWSFSTPSHHQDVRSAARIALFGMFKDDQLNKLLADFILDRIDGNPWTVVHI